MKLQRCLRFSILFLCFFLCDRRVFSSDGVAFWQLAQSDRYAFLRTPVESGDEDGIRKQLPVKMFRLQKWGPPNLYKLEGGTNYKIEFNRDGEATYYGFSGVKRIGKYSAKIDLYDFGRLCLLYEELLTQLKKQDELGHVPGFSHAVISQLNVELEAGKIRVYRDDANFGDIRFWVLENAIQRIYHELEWVKSDNESPD